MESLGRLGAGVAHEIRNPLGVIRTYMYIINNKINLEDDNIKKSIKIVFKSIDRINKIIENLLSFSRLFDNKNELIDFRIFLVETIELENKYLRDNNIQYIINCEDYLHLHINKESMRHIVLNILSNAVDAMPNGGILKLTARKDNGILEIIFEDTGVGISEDMLQFIFEPFYTNKVSSEGTGLGLYLVYTEVKKNNGDIKVSSRVKEGTIFTVTLPIDNIIN